MKICSDEWPWPMQWSTNCSFHYRTWTKNSNVCHRVSPPSIIASGAVHCLLWTRMRECWNSYLIQRCREVFGGCSLPSSFWSPAEEKSNINCPREPLEPFMGKAVGKIMSCFHNYAIFGSLQVCTTYFLTLKFNLAQCDYERERVVSCFSWVRRACCLLKRSSHSPFAWWPAPWGAKDGC